MLKVKVILRNLYYRLRFPPSHIAITWGGPDTMKIRNGWNNEEKKFYIQITEKKSLRSFRIYLDEQSFKNFANGMLMTHHFESSQDSQGSNQSTPHSHKENNQDSQQNSHT